MMSSPTMTHDARLLQVIQEAIPLVRRPFARLGEQIGWSEAEVMERLQQLKTKPNKVIRQISAIFDSGSLGYRSTLVAARIDPSRLEEAAAIISKHPGVSHNYERQHDYNLWYTLAVPPDSQLGLDRTVAELHRQSGALATRMLPTLKLFKIGVKFDMGGESLPAVAKTEAPKLPPRPLVLADKRIIRVLQKDLPIIPEPFDAWAAAAGVPVDTLLSLANEYQQRKWMRRFSAVLHHREAGFTANAMGVWAVPADHQEAFGKVAAGFPQVSHCYLRPSYEDWPYNLFTMVHGTSREGCEKVLADISRVSGITNYRALYSTREFKKIRVQYFLDDIPQWESSVS
jgi:DNA-binding Lrp family transcriptional regulator